MHTARVRSLGKRQQGRFAQVADSVIFDAKVFGSQAGPQQLGQTEEGLRVIFDMTAIRLVTYHELFIAKESEVVAHQPLQEALDLGFFIGIDDVLAVVDTCQQLLDLGFHRLEVGHGDAHFTQNLLQFLAQYIQFSGIGATIDFQVHQRLLRDAFATGCPWAEFPAIRPCCHGER